MNIDKYPSKLLEIAVNEFSKLPGIGKKTALKLVLHLLKQNLEHATLFGNSVIELCRDVKYCGICNNISDSEVCPICSNPSRNQKIVCVVESIKDVLAIENTQQYNGLYHVLGGIISPMDGIGPNDLKIESLEKRLEEGIVNEIIFALSTTMEGDTTNFYLSKRLKKFDVTISIIARGVSFGDELEYTDEITLGRSIVSRTPYIN